ncbi:hypothetical protein FACS1894178_9280 [Bacteroidia bacterium]|nr:hypothetical protein FACS1894178_9280 [Bacteroidia bacterium]
MSATFYKIALLPKTLQREIVDYVDFLLSKQKKITRELTAKEEKEAFLFTSRYNNSRVLSKFYGRVRKQYMQEIIDKIKQSIF